MNIKIGKKYKMGFLGKTVEIVSKVYEGDWGELPWDDYLYQDKNGNLFRKNGEAMNRNGEHLSADCLDICNLVNI